MTIMIISLRLASGNVQANGAWVVVLEIREGCIPASPEFITLRGPSRAGKSGYAVGVARSHGSNAVVCLNGRRIGEICDLGCHAAEMREVNTAAPAKGEGGRR